MGRTAMLPYKKQLIQYPRKQKAARMSGMRTLHKGMVIQADRHQIADGLGFCAVNRENS